MDSSIFVISIGCIIYPYNLGIHFNISLFIGIFMGITYIIVGNYLPKTRQNYTIGFKLPWTYANEENWNKTNRLSGVINIVIGILIIINAAIGLFNIFYSLLVAVIIGSHISYMLKKVCKMPSKIYHNQQNKAQRNLGFFVSELLRNY